MQNFIYRDLDAAQSAKAGRFELRLCTDCGFAWNRAFDPNLMEYGKGYDNDVPSEVMTAYYEHIARYLYDTYDLRSGLVVDVGCGKGTLLKIMTRLYPALNCLGIDPAYDGELQPAPGLLFKREFFDAEQLQERPALVICRHVAEHIPQPVGFFAAIAQGLKSYPGTPLFFEVPDAGWIFRQGAFWDFCYEHCNYFSSGSLARAVQDAGFEYRSTRRGFGDQYLWLEARTPLTSLGARAGLPLSPQEGAAFQQALVAYGRSEAKLFAKANEALTRHHKAGQRIVLWGMATKGVVYSQLMDDTNTLIAHCVDKNPNKQGCFVPLSGHLIEAPESLAAAGKNPLLIVVMNPNYVLEIQLQCAAMGLDAEFMDANGHVLGNLSQGI